MQYSDFMKCKLTGDAKGYMKFLPATRFGPPEKSYYTQENITEYPGLISNIYGKGKSVFIPWELGEQYHLIKGIICTGHCLFQPCRIYLGVERTV